jgi:3-deoxy-D-manno-octulosonate 8-phosphate phosphatase (KDO 8-P phosphatase)
MKDEALAERCRALELILTDVDGVMTEGLSAHEVASIGDDVNDLPMLTEAGLSAAPAGAPLEVRLAAFLVTDARGGGGQGCLREFVEAILRARGDWQIAAAAVGASLPG